MLPVPSLIKNMTEEYIANHGNITCEFTAHPDDIGNICREIFAIKKDLDKVDAYWRITVCDVCLEHHGGENYLHIEIVR